MSIKLSARPERCPLKYSELDSVAQPELRMQSASGVSKLFFCEEPENTYFQLCGCTVSEATTQLHLSHLGAAADDP